MGQSIIVKWDELRSLAFGLVGPAFTAVGSPFEHVVRIIIMQNLTDAQVFISEDGVNDHLTLPAGGQIVLDYMSDKSIIGGSFAQPKGTTIYVAHGGAAPTTGSFFISVIYAKGE